MALSIEKDKISVVIADSLQQPGQRLLCHEIALPFEANDTLLPTVSVLENAVYENPALLADFGSISVSADSGLWTIVPREAIVADMDEAIAIASLPEEKTKRTTALRCPIDVSGAVLVSLLPAELTGFLRRTFNNPALCHPLQLLANHFAPIARLNGAPTMHVHFRSVRQMDIILFDSNRLLLANTFTYHDPMDAVYYILAVASALHIAPENLQLRLSGQPASRRELMPLITPYIPSAMAATFPASLLREGTKALNAPLELTTFVCE